MANEDLFSRIADFGVKKSELNAQSDTLAVELGSEIVERPKLLFEQREDIGLSFPFWLRRQFNTDAYVAWDILTKDPELKLLLQAVDATQAFFASRSRVADVVNTQPLEIPSWVGVNKAFVDISVIGVVPPQP